MLSNLSTLPNLHIITLPQRKSQIEEEIRRLSIDAVFWDAIVLPNPKQAISRSHKRIVKYAKDNGIKEIAIAEDDCIFTSINSWKYFVEKKPDDYDIYLGNHYGGIKRKDNTLFSFSGLTIYFIHCRYYDQFLSTFELKNIDTAQAGKGIFVLCQPEIARQRIGYSYNRKKYIDDDHYLDGRKFLTD